MRVRLLGPIEVWVGATPRPIRGLRRKAVLAALALQPGEIVSTDQLIDIVWGDEAPASAATTLQSHVSHLRRVLGDSVAIVARHPGYVLEIGTEGTDVGTAERLIDQGTEAADPGERESLLQAAIALWRGRPLTELSGLAWFDNEAHRLAQLHLRARLTLVDARMALGQHLQVIAELEDLGREHPLNEQVHGQLMLALYRAGRQADALAAYQRLRRTLNDDLGILPSQPLRALETSILRQESTLDTAPPRSAFPAPAAPPAQLPLALRTFTGRARELAHLDRLLDAALGNGDAGAPAPATVVISAISGTAGIGKTTLAVHWAHRVATRFPDGQLYVNLRGFDPDGPAMSPSEAVRGFLGAFGVPSERIPPGLDAQVGLYRSLLVGKRVLVVLDNARDAEQVRPLLPSAPGCFAVVTSRNRHAPLVATEGAHPLTLNLLSTQDAHDLLTQRLGADRTAAEPDATAEIIERCAGLPLALVITAARAATNPDFPLAALAAQLREANATLDALHGGDPATNVRVAFETSYKSIGTEAAQLFRLLGLHPGRDIGGPSVASLAGIAPDQAARLLAELTGAHLLTEHAPGRFTLHDLLRAYACELVHRHDGHATRRAAVHRTLDHYLHTAHAAARLVFPKRETIAVAAAQPGVIPERLDHRDSALAWFTAEHRALLAALELAVANCFDTHTWQLASAIRTFLLRQEHSAEHIAIQRTALDAARRAGDRLGQAHTLHGLAHTYARSGRFDDAETHYQNALDLYTELDDPAGRARIHTGLAEVAEKQGRAADSLSHDQRALDLYGAAGNAVMRANALNGVGWSHALLGNHHDALASCTKALALLQELGDRDGQARTWDSLGYIHRGLANYPQSITCYQLAIELCRDLGEQFWEADSLSGLGDTYHAAGDPDAAHKAWAHALDILDDLHHPAADRLRARLHEARDT